MDIQSIREYCFRKAGVTEGFPFTEETLVFKVMDKLFLLAAIEAIPLQFNIKCEPEEAIERRERFEAVTPGYHMDKRHWITVKLDGSIPEKEVLVWIDRSYALVAAGLPKKLQAELASQSSAQDAIGARASAKKAATAKSGSTSRAKKKKL